jgi:hypothetical protein
LARSSARPAGSARLALSQQRSARQILFPYLFSAYPYLFLTIIIIIITY